MKWNNGLGFAIATLLLAMIFRLVPFSAERVAFQQLKGKWIQDQNFRNAVSKSCSAIVPATDSKVERFLVEGWPSAAETLGAKPCVLTSVSSHADRFELLHRSHFRINIDVPESGARLERAYQIEFPRPLALLPLACVLFALLFEMPAWAVGTALLLHPFFLSGFNLIRASEDSLRIFKLTLQTDRTLAGALLLALAVLLYRSRFEEGRGLKPVTTKWAQSGNWLLYTGIGLWSPIAHTLVGRLLFPFRATLQRIQGLLYSQLFVLALSLYFLSVTLRTPLGEIVNSISLPRYFTFAALFFFFLQREDTHRIPRAMLWKLPDIKASVLGVLAIELVATVWRPLGQLPTLTRLGGTLVFFELIKAKVPVLSTIKSHVRVFGALLLGSVLSTWSAHSGLVDLLQVLASPQSHPSIIVVSCFTMAALLGFTTGAVTSSFFALYSLLMQTHNLPLVRASLIDGLLLGVLLCPYSFFNLVTAQLFNVRLSALLNSRVQQLAAPALIGFLIFALSSLSTVGILRPTTFVFICLAVGYWKLTKLGWRIPTFGKAVLERLSNPRKFETP